MNKKMTREEEIKELIKGIIRHIEYTNYAMEKRIRELNKQMEFNNDRFQEQLNSLKELLNTEL